MVSRRRFLVMAGSAGAVGAVAIAAPGLLGESDAGGDDLPSVRFGEERCERCGMLIDDVRFVAAWAGTGGEVHFDDIGCLVLEAQDRPAPPAARFYVANYEDGAWIEASSATFVLSEQIRTPMAYGVAAVADPASALRLASETHGATGDWHELPARLAGGGAGEGHAAPSAAGTAHDSREEHE